MKQLLAALSVTVFLSMIAGCERHRDGSAIEAAVPAAIQNAPAVKVSEAAAAPPSGESAGCGGGEGGCCGGGEEMAGGASCGGEGGCNKWDEAAGEVATREVPKDADWKAIPVSGMTCGGCERRIIANLGKLDGVLAVEADAELGQVRVAMARGMDVRKAAVERINSLGYRAE